jgi:hypothetical protein
MGPQNVMVSRGLVSLSPQWGKLSLLVLNFLMTIRLEKLNLHESTLEHLFLSISERKSTQPKK